MIVFSRHSKSVLVHAVHVVPSEARNLILLSVELCKVIRSFTTHRGYISCAIE